MIRKIFAEQGQEIKIGTLLVEMDAEDIRQQLKVATAEATVSQVTLKRIASEITAAKATWEYTRTAFQRSEKLLKSSTEPRSNFEKSQEAMKVAEAVLGQAQIRRQEAEATLAKNQAQIAYYQTKLAETRLASPFNALVVCRNREPGAVVNPGVSILDIVDTSNIWASVWVDETAIAKLQIGNAAEVVFRALPGRKFSGKVCRLWKETDRETREYRVDIALEQLPPNWTLGQRLEVSIGIGTPRSCLVIPEKLLLWKDGQERVLVLSDGKIRERPIKIGIQSQGKAEILDGLRENDRVVTMPLKNLAYVNRRAGQ